MKELQILKKQQIDQLKKDLEKATGLLLPDDSIRFGDLKFHIYSGSKENEFHFQIFWGPHKIFSKKHVLDISSEHLIDHLKELVTQSSRTIAQALTQYCETRLNDFLQIELQPLMMNHGLDVLQIDLKVRRSSKKSPNQTNGGWPIWCLLLSWIDEFGEFQEFVYKIYFNTQSKKFDIPPQEIISQFIKYRNSLI